MKRKYIMLSLLILGPKQLKKESIFWKLPHWRDLQVRHCLGVMHIEKDVCDAILRTLINIPGKNKG